MARSKSLKHYVLLVETVNTAYLFRVTFMHNKNPHTLVLKLWSESSALIAVFGSWIIVDILTESLDL